jgi:hypothetical protein
MQQQNSLNLTNMQQRSDGAYFTFIKQNFALKSRSELFPMILGYQNPPSRSYRKMIITMESYRVRKIKIKMPMEMGH